MNISYLSDEDRERLVILTDQLRSAATAEELKKIREEIAEIEGRRKPLHECDMNECTELRTTIWNKFDRLNKTGKYSIAHQFKLMLTHIERRQMMLHREMALKEAERLKEKELEKTKQLSQAKAKKGKKKDDTSNGETGARNFSSRWTTGIGSLD